ncbi:hypothetical protein WMY93_004492 [Mugilogobius chulae]|uniref:LINE-1 type transposase domain-containing protein 1 n=1 Tax=Mugilogobius chulae TaxID=88201 RepID=A0AAW0PZD2_9GOBI
MQKPKSKDKTKPTAEKQASNAAKPAEADASPPGSDSDTDATTRDTREPQAGERTTDHAAYLENRSRRCNLRVVGLPEGMEGQDILAYMETWIPGHLNLTTKAGKVKLDRAHRSLAPKPTGNQHSKPVILKFHNFNDKQRVMAAAKRQATDQSRPRDQLNVSFFNDFSARVVKQRKAFDEVKSRLRAKKVDYALLYPATLRINVDGMIKRFNSPEEASSFADSMADP